MSVARIALCRMPHFVALVERYTFCSSDVYIQYWFICNYTSPMCASVLRPSSLKTLVNLLLCNSLTLGSYSLLRKSVCVFGFAASCTGGVWRRIRASGPLFIGTFLGKTTGYCLSLIYQTMFLPCMYKHMYFHISWTRA